MGGGARSTPSAGRGSRAFGPGSRRGRRLVAACLIVVLAAVAGVVLATRGGASPPAPLEYGSIPSWLPKPKVAVNRIVQASAAHPQLSAIEGDTVSIHLTRGSVLATVVGPAVPASVAEKAQDDDDGDSDTAPCTFTVTFRSASGVVPLDANTFTILDERGQIHRLRVTAADGGPPAARVTPGRPITLTMEATLPEGEGALRWAPDGPKVIAGWVFGLELD
jgi:hypothetical protein